jgi:hypothetical protein
MLRSLQFEAYHAVLASRDRFGFREAPGRYLDTAAGAARIAHRRFVYDHRTQVGNARMPAQKLTVKRVQIRVELGRAVYKLLYVGNNHG